MATERVWVVETDPVTGEVNRQQAHELLSALEGALWSIGGVMTIAADRELVGHAGDTAIYRTTRYVLKWDSFAPARKPQAANGAAAAHEVQLEEAEAAEAA